MATAPQIVAYVCKTARVEQGTQAHDSEHYLAASLLLKVGGGEGEGVGVVLNLAGLEIEVRSRRLVGQAGEAQHALLGHHTSAAVLGTHHQAHLQDASLLGKPPSIPSYMTLLTPQDLVRSPHPPPTSSQIPLPRPKCRPYTLTSSVNCSTIYPSLLSNTTLWKPYDHTCTCSLATVLKLIYSTSKWQ